MESIIFPVCIFCKNLISLHSLYFNANADLFLKYNCHCSIKNYHIFEAQKFISLITLYSVFKPDSSLVLEKQYYCYSCHHFINETTQCFRKKHFILSNYINNVKPNCELHINNNPESNLNNFYCFKCNKCICLTCKKQEHVNHHITSIIELYEQTKNEYIKKVNGDLEKYIKNTVRQSKISNQSLATSKLMSLYDFFIKCFLNCSPHPIFEIIMILKFLLNVTNINQTIFIVHQPFKCKKPSIKGLLFSFGRYRFSGPNFRNETKFHPLTNGKIIITDNTDYLDHFYYIYSKNFQYKIKKGHTKDIIVLLMDIDYYPFTLISNKGFLFLFNVITSKYISECVLNCFNKYSVDGFFMDPYNLALRIDNEIRGLNLITRRLTRIQSTSAIYDFHSRLPYFELNQLIKINDKTIGIVYTDKIEIWDFYNTQKIGSAFTNFTINQRNKKYGIHQCIVIDNKYLFSINKALDGDYIIYWKLNDFSIDSCCKSSVSITKIISEIENDLIICENDDYELLIFDKKTRQVITVLKNWKSESESHEMKISADDIKYVTFDIEYITVFI